MEKEKKQGRVSRTLEAVTSVKSRAGGFWTEFRDFAVKGDVVDLAIGIVIGGAFNKIVQSLVNDIIMPVLGKLLGNVAFTELYVNLSGRNYDNLADAVADGAPVVKYGVFITNILDFFIVALSIFVILKIFFHKKKEVKEEEK
jgi:large conductance mechanosensitive channel